MKEKDKDEKEK